MCQLCNIRSQRSLLQESEGVRAGETQVLPKNSINLISQKVNQRQNHGEANKGQDKVQTPQEEGRAYEKCQVTVFRMAQSIGGI